MSSKGVMQRLEMFVDQQLLAGMVARPVGVTMLTEVGDVWAGRQHEPAKSLVHFIDNNNPLTCIGKNSLWEKTDIIHESYFESFHNRHV